MTIDDINLVLHEITLTQIEAFNLIDHIHKPKDIWTKRSLLPFGGLFHFLYGMANDDDVRSTKQEVHKLCGRYMCLHLPYNSIKYLA